MRLLIVGAGATGGYFGARLAEAGRDVTFLVRPGRAEQLRCDGLRVASPHGDIALAPKILVAGEASPPFDAVILAVKAYALPQAIADLAPLIGDQTMIIPLLNGMRHLDLLIERFGGAPVLGGVCLIASALDGEGRILHLGETHELKYGERAGSGTARIAALDGLLQGAGFVARLSDNILQEMWEKWTMLATGGALTCLLGGTIGEIEAVPGGAAVALQILAESSAVAGAAGFPPGEAFLERVRRNLTAKGSSFVTSMYRDKERGQPVEVEQILGDFTARAAQLTVPTPLLAAATAQLRLYERRRLGA